MVAVHHGGLWVEVVRAFSPAGISSFFQVCDRGPDGSPLRPERVGARGGGFVISTGVLTEVRVEESSEVAIDVYINGRAAPEAETTRRVASRLLSMVDAPYHVTVHHKVDVPIGAGFGSSGAGALSTALALSRALGLHLTYNQAGMVAHVAEVECKTGLGTVGPLMLGGCVVTVEPGGPGYSLIDRIILPPDCRVVAATISSISTKSVLSGANLRAINEAGERTLKSIMDDPSPENFMESCRRFAVESGLATERAMRMVDAAVEAGAIGATQNMVGEAVHALATAEHVDGVVEAFRKFVPDDRILVAEVSPHGARILG